MNSFGKARNNLGSKFYVFTFDVRQKIVRLKFSRYRGSSCWFFSRRINIESLGLKFYSSNCRTV